MLKRVFPILLAIALLLWASGETHPEEGDDAGNTVAILHTTLLEVMKKAEKLGYEGRYRRLEPVIKKSFDLDFIIRVATGRYWRDFTPEERAEITEKFTDLSISTYAARFDSWSGEDFRSLATEPLKRGRLVVRTNFVKSSGEILDFDYVLHETKEGWRIINVIVDGVSDLSLKRGQYTGVLKDEGFRALIDKMDEKIRDYANGARD